MVVAGGGDAAQGRFHALMLEMDGAVREVYAGRVVFR